MGALAAACLASLLAAGGCTEAPESGDGPAVFLNLTLPSGVVIDSVHYRIHSAQASAPPADKQGDVDTSNPAAQPSVEVSFPASTSDTVTLTATTTVGEPCAGTSAPFTVVSGQQTVVSMTMTCGQLAAPPGPGSVVVNGQAIDHTDICPVISDHVVWPLQAYIGDPINLSVTAVDGDPGDVLSYSWTSNDGAAPSPFANAAAASTQYLCPSSGSFTLTITVNDNHPSYPCSTHLDVAVSCKRPSCAVSGAWADTSGSGHDAVLKNFGVGSGLVGDGSAANPYAMSFDGVDDYAELLPKADGLRITDNVSEEFWIKNLGAAGANESIYSNRNGTSDVSGLSTNIMNGNWAMQLTSDGLSYSQMVDGPAAAAWTQIVVAYSTTNGGARLYVNGALMKIARLFNPVYYSPSAAPRLGELSAALPFKGLVGEARIWQTMLSPAEVLARYRERAPAYGITAPAPSTIVSYPLALKLDASICVGDP